MNFLCKTGEAYRINQKFDQGYFIEKEAAQKLSQYICANLVNSSPNTQYWNEQYSYLNKLLIVIKWREKNGLIPAGRKGEMICKNELINFFEDKSHKSCCGSI